MSRGARSVAAVVIVSFQEVDLNEAELAVVDKAITVNVNNLMDAAPTAAADSFSGDEDITLTGNVLVNDR